MRGWVISWEVDLCQSASDVTLTLETQASPNKSGSRPSGASLMQAGGRSRYPLAQASSLIDATGSPRGGEDRYLNAFQGLLSLGAAVIAARARGSARGHIPVRSLGVTTTDPPRDSHLGRTASVRSWPCCRNRTAEGVRSCRRSGKRAEAAKQCLPWRSPPASFFSRLAIPDREVYRFKPIFRRKFGPFQPLPSDFF